MESKNGFTKLLPSEFKKWLDNQKVEREIYLIQLHHTASPEYKDFKGNNYFEMQQSMKNYHIKARKFADIAQQFSLFPDGVIVTGRNLNVSPAGITGGNRGAICIEIVGNFDKYKDMMYNSQKEALIVLLTALMQRFNLNPDCIRYHAWYTEGGEYLGTYNSKKSVKTCPGTAFFGGNTKQAYETNLKPLLENRLEEEKPMTAEEKKILQDLQNDVKKLKETIEQKMFVYDYIDENMPDWCKPIVRKGIEVGLIKGTERDEKGNITKLGLTMQDIKAVAYDLREKGYKV